MLTKSRVVHCNKESYDVMIDRTTKWGNPFKMDNLTRNEVIELYENYLRSNKELLEALPELEGKVLGCWCKPKYCHGDIIIKLLNERLMNDYLEY